MPNITAQTTLAELAEVRESLGNPTITVMRTRGGSHHSACAHHMRVGFCYGVGEDIAGALDDAFNEIRRRLAAVEKGTTP